MKRLLLGGLLIFTLSASLHAQKLFGKADTYVEVGYGIAKAPYQSKFTDGVFETESLDVKPEEFSPALSNNGDTYIMAGFEMVPAKDGNMGAQIGLRAHQREGVNYEVDFVGRGVYHYNSDWSFPFGGGFGIGDMDIAIKQIQFSNGDVITYPDSIQYSTAFFHLGTEYKISKHWSFSTTYEIKEIAVNSEKLKDQVNWDGPNPLDTLKIAGAVSSYESTTHSLYFSLKCKF